jgi:hypothetical protein
MSPADESRGKRGVPRGVLVLAALSGFLASLGIAIAIASDSGEGDDHAGGPVGKRTIVASGTAPREIGRWRVWRSVDARGEECVEVQLLDDPLDDQAPEAYRNEGAVPVPGGGTLSGGCGNDAELDVASVTASEEVLLYGRAPAAADAVEIEVGGRPERTVKLADAPEGTRSKYFGAAIEARAGAVRARARDAGGRDVGTRDVPTPGGP